MRNQVVLKSEEHILIGNQIASFLEKSKDVTLISKKLVEVPKKKKKNEDEEVEEEKPEFTYEKVEVKAKYTIPFKLKYALKRNLNLSKDIVTVYNDLRNDKVEEIKKELNINEKKFASDAEYKKEINSKLESLAILKLNNDVELKEILKKEEEIGYFTYELTSSELESIDEQTNILAYIPENWFDVIIKIKE